MTNITLYKKVNQLRDFLELHDQDSVSQAKLNKCIEYLNLIFEVLERRERSQINRFIDSKLTREARR